MTLNCYKPVEDLQQVWNELEKLLKGVLAKDDHCPLSTMKIQGTVRLCYNDRPLAECKAQERIEAVDFVQYFLAVWRAARAKMTSDAVAAAFTLRTLVDQFKEHEALPT